MREVCLLTYFLDNPIVLDDDEAVHMHDAAAPDNEKSVEVAGLVDPCGPLPRLCLVFWRSQALTMERTLRTALLSTTQIAVETMRKKEAAIFTRTKSRTMITAPAAKAVARART